MTVIDLLERTYRTTERVLAGVPAQRWDAQSPCAEWTVRDVATHLVWATDAFARIVLGEPAIDPADQKLSDDPAADYRAATTRCFAAFTAPGALDSEHPFPFGPTKGEVIATISLSESLIHGWDLARGAGLTYEPDPAAVAMLNDLPEDGPPPEGMYAPAVPVPDDAAPLTVLLARHGREA